MRNSLTDSAIQTLHAVFDLYERFSKDLDEACTVGCAVCCTLDVTMTTLEGRNILDYLKRNGKYDLLEHVKTAASISRFRPAITTNAFARFCLEGRESPPDEAFHGGRPCPFLFESRCSIYEARPFHCRCFFSNQICTPDESALVEPFLVTVNTVFLQFIENLDQTGYFGNMIDVLLHLSFDQPARAIKTPSICAKEAGELPRNSPLPAFMVPPKHRARIRPLLNELKNISDNPLSR